MADQSPWDLVTVQLRCDQCGKEYEGERPRMWRDRGDPDQVWKSTYCESIACQYAFEQQNRHHKNRTMNPHERRRQSGAPTTIDVPDPRVTGNRIPQTGLFDEERDVPEKKTWENP